MNKFFLSAFALTITSLHALATPPAAPAKPETPAKTVSAPNGRFIFGPLSEYAHDQYMFDTQTGRLWILNKKKIESEEPAAATHSYTLDAIPYVDLDGKAGALPR